LHILENYGAGRTQSPFYLAEYQPSVSNTMKMYKYNFAIFDSAFLPNVIL
jgi:hypothetical protein